MKSAVGPGMVVLIHYTLRDPQGEVIDSSMHSHPLEYLHGARNIVVGLEMELQPGMQFSAEAENGQAMTVWVHSLEGEQVMIDFNHPLAGMELDFEVQVEDVRPATQEEIAHGHPHGPHGHHH
jgi:FKBP-type peptidyl-prolyl cis-trans isomerase SlyD